MATNDDDRDDLSRELEEPGLPDLQQELQNAAIEEMNNVTYGDDVVNDNISDLDNDSEGGEDDDVSMAPSVARSMASRRSQRSAAHSTKSAPSPRPKPSVKSTRRSKKTKAQTKTTKTQYVTVDGMKIPIENKVIDLTQTTEAPSYPLEDRLKMVRQSEIEDLKEKATKGNRVKFTVFNPQEKSQDILNETTSLEGNISDLTAHLVKYDMKGVFNIKEPDPNNPQKLKVVGNLLQDYATITIKQIRKSNLWYSQQPKGAYKRVFKENLDWSESYLDNSVSQQLRIRVTEKYRAFASAQRGGPLFFKLIMDELVINTREVADHLVDKLKAYKLSKVKGEDVTAMTRIVRASVRRLKNMKDPVSGTSYLPKDLAKKLLDILQTSLVPDFNKRFQMRKEIAEAAYGSGDPDYGDVEDILKQADKEYAEMMRLGTWLGTNPSGEQHESSFTANRRNGGRQGNQNGGRRNHNPNWKKEATCFNCKKKGHLVDDCRKPLDQERIARNKKKFEKDKKQRSSNSNSSSKTETKEKNGSNKGLWTPPSAHEARFGNKRIIHGAVRIYDPETKKWNIEKTTSPPPAPTAQASSNNNATRTRTRCQNGPQGQGNVAGANPDGQSDEKDAIFEMHMAQFRNTVRDLYKN